MNAERWKLHGIMATAHTADTVCHACGHEASGTHALCEGEVWDMPREAHRQQLRMLGLGG